MKEDSYLKMLILDEKFDKLLDSQIALSDQISDLKVLIIIMFIAYCFGDVILKWLTKEKTN
jgi:hypothetical protein